MFGPFQVAASSRTRFVESETSESRPPITPAIPPDGPASSQIRTMSESRTRSLPSSVVIFSPSAAARTTRTPPAT